MANSATFVDVYNHWKVVDDRSAKTLRWTQGVAESLSCVTVGGYPPPMVAVQMDSVDITNQFSLSYSATLHGTRGLRVMTYTNER